MAPAWVTFVGAALAYRRVHIARLTQRQVVERMRWPGFERTHLGRVEHGRHVPAVDLLAAIAAALGCRLVDVVRDAERWAELDADAADHGATA